MQKTDISIGELVKKVERGELRLPEMQRRYVWPATRVRDLLDSLYRSYPSGTILVWETDEDIEARDLATRPTNTPTTSQKLLLLDGQQRITSLNAILKGQPVKVRSKSKEKMIDIMFNLDHPEGAPLEAMEIDETDFNQDLDEFEGEEAADRDIQEELSKRTFVVASRALKNNPVWISVSDIFVKREAELLRPLGINSDDERWDKYSDRIKKVRDIENYMYSMQTLGKNLSYEEVTEIFVRVNSLGIKLRGSDLALAQISSRWKGFVDVMEDFASEFGEDENYIIESGLPVRTMVIFATKQSKFKTVSKISKEKLENSWREAISGLRFAVDFIRNNAGIESLSYLSSPFLVIPIAVYATLNGEKLSNEEEKKLLKWLYYAHMRGHYSLGSSETILDADLSVLFKEKNLDSLMATLVQHVKRLEVEAADLIGKSIRSPFFSMLYFVLRKNGAEDWFTGIKLSDNNVSKNHTIQFHHIFPKSLLRDAGYDRKEINELSNLAFIGGKTNRKITNKEPNKYFIEDVISNRGEEALIRQLIPVDKSLWEIDKFKDFLNWRRNKIVETINNFMSQFNG